MKNKIIKYTNQIKVAVTALFFVSMFFNVAMISSSFYSNKMGLNLNGVKVLDSCGVYPACRGDFDCDAPGQICDTGTGCCVYGEQCDMDSDCTYPQTCVYGYCRGGEECTPGTEPPCPDGYECGGPNDDTCVECANFWDCVN